MATEKTRKLTVRELVPILEKMPSRAEVYVSTDGRLQPVWGVGLDLRCIVVIHGGD